MVRWILDCAVGVHLVETGHALSQQYPRHALSQQYPRHASSLPHKQDCILIKPIVFPIKGIVTDII